MYNTRQYIKTAALTFCIAVFGFSCKKSFLEVTPKGKVIATKTSEYDLLLNNTDLININADAQIPMGDEVAAVDPSFSAEAYRPQRLFRWEADVYQPADDAPETVIPLRGLFAYNMIINEVLNSTEGTDLQKKNVQAEALAGRAWTYFLLINYYGKPYNAATAATDPGFPIITAADITQSSFSRATVQEVYDLMVKDLITAIPNLSSDGTWSRIRMSKCAAQALLAKIYIFMGRYSDALPLLNSAIALLPSSTIATDFYDYNAAFPGFPTIVNDQENVYAKNIFNTYTGASTTLQLTPTAGALYGSTDLRRSKWYVATSFPNGLTLLRRSGNYSNSYGIRVPDMYLLRAECKARANDLSGAVSDLETLRKKRMPVADAAVPAAAAAQKATLVQYIMEERIREFAVQGFRWFDMRRLTTDPLYAGVTYQHLQYGADGTVKTTFSLKPERLTLRIPPKILLQNPNLADNP